MVSVLMIRSFSWTAQPVLILLPCPLVWSVFHQFVYEHVMEQSVEILVKAKINNTKCSLLLPQVLSYKDIRLIRHHFPFINHADYSVQLLVLYMFGNYFSEDLLHQIPRDWGEADHLVVLSILLLVLHEGWHFPSIESPLITIIFWRQ